MRRSSIHNVILLPAAAALVTTAAARRGDSWRPTERRAEALAMAARAKPLFDSLYPAGTRLTIAAEPLPSLRATTAHPHKWLLRAAESATNGAVDQVACTSIVVDGDSLLLLRPSRAIDHGSPGGRRSLPESVLAVRARQWLSTMYPVAGLRWRGVGRPAVCAGCWRARLSAQWRTATVMLSPATGDVRLLRVW